MRRTNWLWASCLVIAGVFSSWGVASVRLSPPVLVEVRPNPPVVDFPVLIVLHHPLLDIQAGRLQWRFAGQSEWHSLPGCQLRLPPVSETPMHLQFRMVDMYGRTSPVTELLRLPVPAYPRVWVIGTEPSSGPIYGQPLRVHAVGQSPLLRKVHLEWRWPGQATWRPVPASGIVLDTVNSLRVRVELRGVDETGLASPPSLHTWNTDPLMRSYPVAQLAGLRFLLPLHAVAIVPGTKLVLFGGEKGLLGLLDLDSGTVQLLPGHDPEKSVWDIAAVRTPSGQLLGLSAGEDGKAYIWDLQNRKTRDLLSGHADSVNAVAFSPDGRVAFTGGNDGFCLKWDVETGKLLNKLNINSEPICCLRSWTDGQELMLAVATADGQFHVWNAISDTKLASQPAHREKICALAIYRDGRILSTGYLPTDHDQPCVRLWRYTAPEKLEHLLDLTPKPLSEPQLWYAEAIFTAAQFTPDGRYVLACDLAGRLTMWNLATSCLTRTLTQPDPGVYQRQLGFTDMDLTPDGNFAITSDRAGYLRVWFVGERH